MPEGNARARTMQVLSPTSQWLVDVAYPGSRVSILSPVRLNLRQVNVRLLARHFLLPVPVVSISDGWGFSTA